MDENYKKLFTEVGIEMAKAEVAAKEGATVRANECLLRAKANIGTFLQKQDGYG